MSSGPLTATTDTAAAVADADAVVVVVPLFVDADGHARLQRHGQRHTGIAAGMRPGTLVTYETTLPVGFHARSLCADVAASVGARRRTRLLPRLQPGAGVDRPGLRGSAALSQLIGGIDDESARRATPFYEAVLDFDDRPDLSSPNGVWDLGSAEAAELAKLAETTYRDVNIGLANQFARYADTLGIDIAQGDRGLQHPAV